MKFLHGNLNEAGKEELNDWINESLENKQLFEKLTNMDWVSGELGKLYSYDKETGWRRVSEVFPFEMLRDERADTVKDEYVAGQPRVRLWKKLAAAAAIFILVTGSYILFFKDKKDEPAKANVTIPHDVMAPGSTKAMIVLSNGEKVLLDTVSVGMLAMQHSVKVEKSREGEIIYSGKNDEVGYHTLYNPRGSKTVSLTLADGTKVWMNTASSMKYFTSVGKGERRVEITGECYFEVARDPSKAFIVKDVNRGAEIKVLGTHFNVNSYTDESEMKVTLLGGSINIVKGNAANILKPGEQARVANDIKVVSSVDLDEVMAWKNDRFQFNKASLQEVMRQIGRWYDVEISYEGEIEPQKFGGKMQRDLNLSEVLEGLEKTQVHFRIEGRKLIVVP